MTYRALGRLFAVLVAIATWVALGRVFHSVLQPHLSEADWDGALSTLLSAFAVPTAILIALALSVAAIGGRRAPWPSVMTALAVYAAMVLALHLFNVSGVPVAGNDARRAALVLIWITPILFLVYWLFFVPKGHAARWAPLLWLVFPAAFVAVVVWRGNQCGHYPVAFFDVARYGSTQLAFNCVIAVGAFAAGGIVFRAIDRLLRPLAMD